jgi:hypothetical protein
MQLKDFVIMGEGVLFRILFAGLTPLPTLQETNGGRAEQAVVAC